MPRYSRVSYHQKGPRTQFSIKVTAEIVRGGSEKTDYRHRWGSQKPHCAPSQGYHQDSCEFIRKTYLKKEGGPRSRRRPLSATQHHSTTLLVGISWHCN